jgi:protein arginine kinase activator
MLCEKCGKNQANTLIRESIGGKVKEVHLCSECAAKLGYDSLLKTFSPLAGFSIGLPGILGSLLSQGAPEKEPSQTKRCSFCGTSFDEIAQSAMTGCAHCYKEFYQELLPSIQRIHGRTHHVGKIPQSAGRELKLKNELTGLRKELEDAVTAQEYEKAAVLRDRIKELEKKTDEA